MHLIIAEKNISARRIAEMLAGKAKLAAKTSASVPAYHFDDTAVMGLRGHVVEIDFQPGYSNWRSQTHPPRSLIDAGMEKRPTEKRIVAQIQKYAKNASKVTIATDFDTEGELIGKEAYELVRAVNANVPVFRARFSAITPAEIQAAFSEPASLDFDLAAAGEARQIVDLMWGASLTRFISLAARRGGANILSVGRVQSPTLAMIVDREKEIEVFVPEPYWILSVVSDKDGQPLSARHTHGRYWDGAEAAAARDRTREPLTVESATEGVKNDRPPAPLDTTTFIVAASRLGFSASKAMRLAEDLYMNGFISYPRTDNTVYPPSLDLDGILVMLGRSAFASEAAWVRANRRPVPTRGKKSSTDHPPIHPAGPARREQLPDDQWKIYELVVRRFMATLSPDARWKTLKYIFDASGEPYTATGSRLELPGYRTVYPYSDAQETILPALTEGERLPLRDVVLEEKETNPPPRYSQARLIQAMEELGLGTKSTRHEVISKLLSRRYVEGSPLRPTLVGFAVTESLENHAALITKPDMTRTLEYHMEEIKKAKRNRDDVVAESRVMLHEVFEGLEAHEEVIGEEIMERTDEERIIGPCPVCGHDLVIRHAKGMKQFIGCSHYPSCTFNIGLPSSQWGRAIRTDDRCGAHGLAGIRLVRKGARPWDIGCPLCNHMASNRQALEMMPSVNAADIDRLHASHYYTVHDIVAADPATLARVLETDEAHAAEVRNDAQAVLERLRKRSELRKFIRQHLPFRRGRSPSKVAAGIFELGVDEVFSLSKLGMGDLKKLKLSEDEAAALLNLARQCADESRLRTYGVPLVSLKKYRDAGFSSPEDFCFIHPAYLSTRTGISLETVQKHVAKVCEGMGVRPPGRTTKAALESGRARLLALPGLGEASYERLLRAGIISSDGLRRADPEDVAAKTGIAAEKIRAWAEAAEVEG